MQLPLPTDRCNNTSKLGVCTSYRITIQKVDSFHTLADKFLHELHDDIHTLNQSESDKRDSISVYSNRINNFKNNLEKTIKSIGIEEDNVIRAMKLARTKSLFNKADAEFGKKNQQKNMKLLSSLHDM